MKPIIYSLCLLVSAYQIPATAAQNFSSGLKKVPLIELYTSEGCSSCPPADQWLSQFKDDTRLWKEFVPIAFHVDYWDYIGWKDPFAKRENSTRQRRYNQQGNIKSVYTPGLILMGQEWRTWYYEKTIPNIDWSEVGDLSVSINGDVVEIKYTSSQQEVKTPSQLKANISILGFDLTSKIKRGENRGKTLKHEFVNLAHIKAKADLILTEPNSAMYQWTMNIPKQFVNSKDSLGIAVWVSTTDRQQPIQATGDWLK